LGTKRADQSEKRGGVGKLQEGSTGSRAKCLGKRMRGFRLKKGRSSGQKDKEEGKACNARVKGREWGGEKKKRIIGREVPPKTPKKSRVGVGGKNAQ